ncbi:TPA: GNAT family N-acetyltransferase [Candidatus Poribacteria bacterium]|jgi:hypothetical protein|nr:GNAT family N-acetyltransferase [Candidatus Poribacteria bacterium]HIA68564.1 GNAT family N-acetyltransferase [Candidatus Poribacteria bacterium]HIO07183.1 GNAT family N-acetyltransferase [Candidatus Poribacteria bacterium]HIO80718.1 GNAT family N-acetyltransferase [Candidatus Poribacteria bacterium]
MKIECRAPRSVNELNDSVYYSICSFEGSDKKFSEDHFFTLILKKDPWFCLDNTRACFVDGKVVSVVQIFERPLRLKNCVLRMGGLGSVGTHPNHRQKGYSSEVLLDI